MDNGMWGWILRRLKIFTLVSNQTRRQNEHLVAGCRWEGWFYSHNTNPDRTENRFTVQWNSFLCLRALASTVLWHKGNSGKQSAQSCENKVIVLHCAQWPWTTSATKLISFPLWWPTSNSLLLLLLLPLLLLLCFVVVLWKKLSWKIHWNNSKISKCPEIGIRSILDYLLSLVCIYLFSH